MPFLTWILSWFGGGPLGKIIDGLNRAYADALNAKTKEEEIAAKDRIDVLNAALADVQDARRSAGALPRWMAVVGFMIGFPFGLHVFLIGIGTSFQPLIIGGWLGDWLLHIPPFPRPFDTQEAAVIAFFYGGLAVVGGASAIAGAISTRRR